MVLPKSHSLVDWSIIIISLGCKSGVKMKIIFFVCFTLVEINITFVFEERKGGGVWIYFRATFWTLKPVFCVLHEHFVKIFIQTLDKHNFKGKIVVESLDWWNYVQSKAGRGINSEELKRNLQGKWIIAFPFWVCWFRDERRFSGFWPPSCLSDRCSTCRWQGRTRHRRQFQSRQQHIQGQK